MKPYPQHIMNGNVLSDGHNEGNFSFYSFFNSARCLVSSDIYSCGIWLKLLHCLPESLLAT